MRLPMLLADDPTAPFPDPRTALIEPDGLLAVGGDLSVPRLVNAYSNGIFPWYSQGEPILWWSPSHRAVFRSDAVHVGGRQRRALRNSGWVLRADTAFDAVIAHCAAVPRPGQSGTWITPEMIAGYRALHRAGHAHSVEVFDGDTLVGGLYGVAVGRMFCGESMFSVAGGASTLALLGLAQVLHSWGWPLIDAQILNDHTQRLGACAWPREDYLRALAALVDGPGRPGAWTAAIGQLSARRIAA